MAPPFILSSVGETRKSLRRSAFVASRCVRRLLSISLSLSLTRARARAVRSSSARFLFSLLWRAVPSSSSSSSPRLSSPREDTARPSVRLSVLPAFLLGHGYYLSSASMRFFLCHAFMNCPNCFLACVSLLL